MKAACFRRMMAVTALCLPLVALFGCDDNDHHHGDWDTDAILAIIYGVGDVVLAIIQAVT